MHLRSTGGRTNRSPGRGLIVAAALATAGVLAAACGGAPSASVANLGSSNTTTTTSASTNGGRSGNPSSNSGGGGPQGGHSVAAIGGVTVQFSQCMRTHGEPNFPDPNSQGQVTFSGVDPGSASFQAAQRACAKYSPNGGKPPTAAQQQQAEAQALKFSECMRSHGISDFPDPQTGPGGGIRISLHAGQGSSNLNPNNPQFQAAQKACQSVAPFGKGLPAATKS